MEPPPRYNRITREDLQCNSRLCELLQQMGSKGLWRVKRDQDVWICPATNIRICGRRSGTWQAERAVAGESQLYLRPDFRLKFQESTTTKNLYHSDVCLVLQSINPARNAFSLEFKSPLQ